MTSICKYQSQLGTLLLRAEGGFLTGLFFDKGQQLIGSPCQNSSENEVLSMTCRWLDSYFSGQIPAFTPPMSCKGTDFQMSVWQRLQQIPYGQSISYGAIAAEIAAKQGRLKMSAQAVGNAVGSNPISIIIPCHRVLGINGSLTGYGGGLDRKKILLDIEGIAYK